MAFDGKDYVIGIYGLAIVKLGPFAQVENPGLASGFASKLSAKSGTALP
jgi:hypothetical protein